MKKIVFSVTLLIVVIKLFSQSPALSKDYYLQKSKTQKKTAWILLTGGTIMAVGGLIAFGDSWDSESYSKTDILGFVTLGGVVADLASIPFFISAAKNKSKGLSVAISNPKTPALSKDYFSKKSKTQKTVAWAMLGGGVAMTTIGYLVKNKQFNEDPINAITNEQGYIILMTAGGITALGSIPFFISSAKNAGKAGAISFNYQEMLFPEQNTFVLKKQPTVTLKIEL